jgi:hypothetical protein
VKLGLKQAVIRGNRREGCPRKTGSEGFGGNTDGLSLRTISVSPVASCSIQNLNVRGLHGVAVDKRRVSSEKKNKTPTGGNRGNRGAFLLLSVSCVASCSESDSVCCHGLLS